MRLLITLGTAPALTSPLLVDYVEAESRGKANGLVYLFGNFGLLAMNYGVFEVAKRLELKWAFVGFGGITFLVSTALLFMIKNVKSS